MSHGRVNITDKDGTVIESFTWATDDEPEGEYSDADYIVEMDMARSGLDFSMEATIHRAITRAPSPA